MHEYLKRMLIWVGVAFFIVYRTKVDRYYCFFFLILDCVIKFKNDFTCILRINETGN